jgi:two-component system chemotaxis response regulator CheB
MSDAMTYERGRREPVIAIGTSTGGTRALASLLPELPANGPGVVIVQHMPGGFTAAFARRLDALCGMKVREARDGDALLPGLALLAPGDHHMVLESAGRGYAVRITDAPPVHHQRPSVDVLFESVARSAGRYAVGVVLTGMGGDGARGLLEMRGAGAHTIAEDESTCAVYGMPREAVRLGAACEVLPLPGIARAALAALKDGSRFTVHGSR